MLGSENTTEVGSSLGRSNRKVVYSIVRSVGNGYGKLEGFPLIEYDLVKNLVMRQVIILEYRVLLEMASLRVLHRKIILVHYLELCYVLLVGAHTERFIANFRVHHWESYLVKNLYLKEVLMM